MFKVVPSKIPGCFEITCKTISDNRGPFIKTFHVDLFRELNIEFNFSEEYFSTSIKNVFRGLHFQVPPKAIDKMIFCVSGAVTDYVVDLRKGSPTFGQWASFELDDASPKVVLVPKGLAHGFYARSDKAIMQCKSSGVFDGPSDKAISYTTFSFAEDIQNPVLSDKDKTAPLFTDFETPFTF